VTDEEMTRVAEILRKQLHGATPEEYPFIRETVWYIYVNFHAWFLEDPDFLPDRFQELVFEGYPADLYSGR